LSRVCCSDVLCVAAPCVCCDQLLLCCCCDRGLGCCDADCWLCLLTADQKFRVRTTGGNESAHYGKNESAHYGKNESAHYGEK
jgi:hypothetical protein